MSKETGGPAFPTPGDKGSDGMTLRDYFAAKVMQGLIAEGGEYTDPEIGAEKAYRHADAMLKEREK